MTSWDDLVGTLQLRWDDSREDVCGQLVYCIKYAIFTPLSAVRTASQLLSEHADSPHVRSWAKECHQTCNNWKDNYWKIQDGCLSKIEDKEKACLCILDELKTLFANLDKVLEQGESILQFLKGDMADLGKILIKTLSLVKQIEKNLQEQDLSWLMEYLDNEAKLSQRRIEN